MLEDEVRFMSRNVGIIKSVSIRDQGVPLFLIGKRVCSRELVLSMGKDLEDALLDCAWDKMFIFRNRNRFTAPSLTKPTASRFCPPLNLQTILTRRLTSEDQLNEAYVRLFVHEDTVKRSQPSLKPTETRGLDVVSSFRPF